MIKENIEERVIKLLSQTDLRIKKINNYFGCYHKEDKLYLQNVLMKLQLQGRIYNDEGVFKIFPSQYKVVTLEQMNYKKVYRLACFKSAKNVPIPIKDENLNGALIGDIVVLDEKKRTVKKILKRKISKVHCEVIMEDGIKKLKPLRISGDEYINIRISYQDMKRLVPGDVILVDLSTNTYDDYFEADMIEKIGHKDDPDLALSIIASNHGFFLHHSKNAQEEVSKLPTKVTEEDRKNRIDLRGEEIFTIDGDHTKDMDDAIGLKKLADGNYFLTVSIADVSHYVKPGSYLWQEAQARSTSLYMVNTVIPMFPHLLSNGICSLNEKEDRLTLTCFIKLDKEGKVLEYRVAPTVIHSKKKMTYSAVTKVLNDEKVEGYEPFKETLHNMAELAHILKENRGALPFLSGDISYTLDDDKNIINFSREKNNEAMGIIEEFMVLANVCMAKYSCFLGLATPYRIHEAPDEFKIDELFEALTMSGYDISNCKGPNLYVTLRNILQKYQNTLDFDYVSNLILKAMKRAKYSSYNEGHYALKESYYAHFTSPIRRFPDLLLHYQIHSVLDDNYLKAIKETKMEELCNHASFMEQASDAAEKEADEYTILNYMAHHPEKIYRGYIEEVGEDYIHVVTNTGIKGKIFYSSLPEKLTILKEKGAIYFHKDLYLKVGNVCLFKATEVNTLSGEVTFDIEKNLSVRLLDKDYTRVLKRVN